MDLSMVYPPAAGKAHLRHSPAVSLLCGCDHNLRLILKKLRFFYALIWLISYHLLISSGASQPHAAAEVS